MGERGKGGQEGVIQRSFIREDEGSCGDGEIRVGIGGIDGVMVVMVMEAVVALVVSAVASDFCG